MEEPLPAGGSCLLGSINLSGYVDDGKFDLEEFKKDIHIIIKGLNEVLDQGLPLHPLEIQRTTVRDLRQIGLGIMGLGDMLIKLGLKYGDEDSLKLCDTIGWNLANESIKASALLAKEFGAYPKYTNEILNSEFIQVNTDSETYELVVKYGLRNSQLLTSAPTGTLSTMLEITGGIEPMFATSYNRKTQSLYGEDVYYKVFTPIVREYMDKNNVSEDKLPEYFVTAMELNPFNRVKMQGIWQNHIDASISSTINLPNETTVDEVEKLYISAWKHGLKGMTIYRSGCEREGVLSLDNEKKDKKTLGRGEWSEKPADTIEIQRKIKTGCGKEMLHIAISPSEKRVVEVYTTSSSAGGCHHNIQAVSILLSGMLRVGADLNTIKCSFRGLGGCPSFAKAKEKGLDVSAGKSCPTAILTAVLQVQKELENEELLELKLLNYYAPRSVENTDVTTEPASNKNSKMFTEAELKYIEEYGEVAYAQRYGKCPKCGENMEHVGGCISCSNCSFTKCE